MFFFLLGPSIQFRKFWFKSILIQYKNCNSKWIRIEELATIRSNFIISLSIMLFCSIDSILFLFPLTVSFRCCQSRTIIMDRYNHFCFWSKFYPTKLFIGEAKPKQIIKKKISMVLVLVVHCIKSWW